MSLDDDLREAEQRRERALAEARKTATKDALVMELAESLSVYRIALKDLQNKSSSMDERMAQIVAENRALRETEGRIVDLAVSRVVDSAAEKIVRQGAVLQQEGAKQMALINRQNEALTALTDRHRWLYRAIIIVPVVLTIAVGVLLWQVFSMRGEIEDTRAMTFQGYAVGGVGEKYQELWKKQHPTGGDPPK